jgi:hypothetical protein
LRDLSPASLKTLADKGSGGDKKGGVVATSLKLAGYVKNGSQTLPDDSSFHSIWSLDFKAADKQLYILTGNFGSASTPGCLLGDSQYSERVLLDGNTFWEHDSDGTNTGTPPQGFLTFSSGNHTLEYEVRGDCPGFPASVQGEEILMIPFTLP